MKKGERNLNLSKTEKILGVSLVLMLVFTAIAAGLQSVAAHTPPLEIPTFAYVSVSANPVGKGQTVFVFMWLDKAPPTATGPYGDRWENFKVTVTKPDQTSKILGPFKSDPIGFYSTGFTPDQLGNYTFVFNFPGQTLAGKNLAPPMWPGGPTQGSDYIGDYFKPSTSDPVTLTVQEQPVPDYPATPLPTEFWTRPINAQSHDWYSFAGNWLMLPSNSFARYTQGPNTAHIMWTKPLTFGGLVGGEFGTVSYYTGNAYEGKWWPPVIISGVLYYNQFPNSMAYSENMGFSGYIMPGVHAVDLRTGEEKWYNPNMRIDLGQIYHYDSMNQHGAMAYLWQYEGSTWICYDAFTGQWIYNITNVPSGIGGGGLFGGPLVFGSDGSMQGLVVGPSAGMFGPPVPLSWITLWNPMTIPELTGAADIPGASLNGTAGYMWRPFNKVVDGNHGFVWNKTLSSSLSGSMGINYILQDGNGNLDSVLLSEFVTQFGGAGFFSFDPTANFTVCRVNLKPGQEGQILWKQTYSTLAEGGTMAMGPASLEDKVFTVWCSQTRQHWGFSLDDGSQIWGPTGSQASWDFTVATTSVIAYGKLLSIGMGGVLYIYDVKTGTLLHETPLTIPYLSESKWSGNSPIACVRVADGKIYLFTGEHSPDNPAERATPLACVDVETGELLWSIPFYASHWATNPALADGYLVYMNAYDLQIYCFGKGPSATTIEAPLVAIPKGTPLVLQGTVTDQSAGGKGTPAIADENMSAWMAYLYMQQPKPTTATGVAVRLTAVDPNGNTIDIGTTTSDAKGMFSYIFTPDKEGKYIITANFDGTDSYWPSSAETAIVVGAAPSASPTVTPTPTVTTAPTPTATPTTSPSAVPPPQGGPGIEMYVVPAVVVIILAIAIAAVLLKKRK
jgi:hypothetical protein